MKIPKDCNDIWLTSDTHIGHRNICKGISEWPNKEFCRNFNNTEEMFDVIVNNFNKVIPSNGYLIHLGDLNFGNPNNGYDFLQSLNCKNIILIRGNHDAKHHYKNNPIVTNGYNNDLKKNMFFSDMFLEDCLYKEIFYQKTRICMFHYPLASWNEMSKGSIHLHGHTHRTLKDKYFNGGKSMDIGVDGNNMMPYHIDEIMNIMKDKPIKTEGHHI